MIIVIFQLQFTRADGKDEFANSISEDIVCGLDVERFFDLGIWSADEMEEDQSGDRCRDYYVYEQVSIWYCRKRCKKRMGRTYQVSHAVCRQKERAIAVQQLGEAEHPLVSSGESTDHKRQAPAGDSSAPQSSQ